MSGLALAVAAAMRRYPFRGKTLLWNQFERRVPHARYTVRMPGGGRMVIDAASYWQRQMMAACFERRSVWLLKQVLRAGDAFVDGGANCGYFSCLAAGLVGPAGRVVAVDADARVIEQLREQSAINPVIVVHHAALTRAAGTIQFYVPPHMPGAFDIGLATLDPHEGWRAVPVPGVTLDDIIDSIPGGVRLLKLDVEGHEGPALEGARRSLESGRLESVLVEIRESTAAITELLRYEFDAVLDVPSGFVPIDPRSFTTRGETDLVFLRGESWRRWQAASSGWTRWV